MFNKYRLIYFILLTVLFCDCIQKNQLSINQLMQNLQLKDAIIDDFSAEVVVKMYEPGKRKLLNEYRGKRYYKKPDMSLILLESDDPPVSLITSEVGTSVRIKNSNSITIQKIKDSLFLRDLRSILNIFFQKGRLPSDAPSLDYKVQFRFKNGKERTLLRSDNQYWIEIIVHEYEKADLLVDYKKGVVLEKIVYSLPDNKIVSEEKHRDFFEFEDGFIPTKTTYFYQGIQSVMQLKNLKVNTHFSNEIFETLKVNGS